MKVKTINLGTKRRRGAVEMEAVMVLAVMFPLSVALLWGAFRLSIYCYQFMSAMIEWPFL